MQCRHHGRCSSLDPKPPPYEPGSHMVASLLPFLFSANGTPSLLLLFPFPSLPPLGLLFSPNFGKCVEVGSTRLPSSSFKEWVPKAPEKRKGRAKERGMEGGEPLPPQSAVAPFVCIQTIPDFPFFGSSGPKKERLAARAGRSPKMQAKKEAEVGRRL